jgi:8-oxo-dGTP pyrophosphatase MutT (NUDIX family)
MNDSAIWDRVTGRVILLDGAGRVLLFEGVDPADPGPRWWFTPGGGTEAEESARDAAARELFEETGQVVDPAELGEQVFQNYVEFMFDGRLLRQHNHFYVLRASSTEISTAGFDDVEQRSHLGHRWWSAEELEESSATYYPVELAALVKELREA